MPATRLLVLADPKMLPALASGLREGGRFDVLTLPFGDAGASAAAQRADALAVFYGMPDRPLQTALQALAPAVRGRGGRVVAVLQREQAAQRDDCFKAGASDLLFMPMPKEQFVARLADAVVLTYAPERGAPSAVQVGARGNLVQLAQATVTAAGVHAAAGLPFQAGETVRLSWGGLETWGLVVRASPDAQVRFAGVTPEEDARIRDWLRQALGGASARPALVPAAPAAAPRTAPPARPGTAPAGPAARGSAPVAPRPPPQMMPRAAPVMTPAPPARPGAPAAASAPGSQGGPPPGFAERPRVKDSTPVRPPPTVVRAPAGGNGARPGGGSAPARAANAAVPSAPAQAAAAPGLHDLFDDGSAPPAAEPEPGEPPPMWPPVPPAEECLLVGIALVRDKKAPADAAPDIAAAAKKITGVLNLNERAALEKAGTESHFADALAARIALDVCRAEATRLFSHQPPALVDDASVKTMIQVVDAASARLQKEADGAISRGEVESLQLITASSAALSRDLHGFKEMADRLRGVGSAPRLGAGSLDPDVVLPGQSWRPPPKAAEPARVRPELREFQGLGEGSAESRRSRTLVVCMLALGAALINVMFFAYPRVHELPPVPGVARIEVSGSNARVTLGSDFAENQEQAIAALVQVLRARGVQNAVLMKQNGSGAGNLSVTDGKAFGVPPAVRRNDIPLPAVPIQTPAPAVAPQATQPPAQPGRAPAPAQTAAGQPRQRR